MPVEIHQLTVKAKVSSEEEAINPINKAPKDSSSNDCNENSRNPHRQVREQMNEIMKRRKER